MGVGSVSTEGEVGCCGAQFSLLPVGWDRRASEVISLSGIVLCNRLTKNTKLICDIKFIAFADSDLPLHQRPRLVTTNPQRTSDR